MHEHRYLPLGIDALDLRVLRVVEARHMERHHGDLHVEALFMRGDLGLRAEHAERPGIEPHRHSRNLVDHSSLTKKRRPKPPFPPWRSTLTRLRTMRW